MKIPPNLTEQHTIDVIQAIANGIADKFVFGYYDVEDIRQEAFLLGMDALERYDGERPLENFLYVHIRNRLKTLKRDKYKRLIDCPNCKEDEYCDLCEKRKLKSESKRNLMEPLDIAFIDDEKESNTHTESNILSQLEINEISSIIDQHLDLELRLDYLKMLDGVYIQKVKRQKIEQRILEILEEYGQE